MTSYPQYPPQEPGPQMQPMPQPIQPQYYPKPPTPLSELFSNSILLLFILAGLLLTWIGVILVTVGAFSTPTPNTTLIEASYIIFSLGTLLLSFVFFAMPLIRKEMHHWVKVAFIVAAIILVYLSIAIPFTMSRVLF